MLAGDSGPFFPLEVDFGRAKPSDPLPEVDAGLRALVDGSAAALGYGYTLETEKRQTRVNEQTYPTRLYFPDERNFLRYIGKEREVATVRGLVAETERMVPEIGAWARTHPGRLLQVADRWDDLLKVFRYLCDHPRPDCFPRELPLDVSGKLLGDALFLRGKRRRPHLFRAVLSHSRKGYSEVVRRQDTETFVRCCENAFRHFGGVTRTTVVDNLKAAVLDPDWFDPNFNPKMADFARHYGTVVVPTQPARPEHKGKIEAGVKYAQNNALRGRRFASFAEQNLFLTDWERRVSPAAIASFEASTTSTSPFSKPTRSFVA
jgi:hypothetical protein